MLKNVLSLCFVLLFAGSAPVSTQEPDYYQLDPKPYDPDVDVNMDMFISHWKESMPHHIHGSIIARDIFTQCKGDPLRWGHQCGWAYQPIPWG